MFKVRHATLGDVRGGFASLRRSRRRTNQQSIAIGGRVTKRERDEDGDFDGREKDGKCGGERLGNKKQMFFKRWTRFLKLFDFHFLCTGSQ